MTSITIMYYDFLVVSIWPSEPAFSLFQTPETLLSITSKFINAFSSFENFVQWG
jgi:hypothetical protein